MTWDFVKAHWPKLGWAAPVLLVTTVKGCVGVADLGAKLAACEAKPPVIQVQTVTVKERCIGKAEVIPQADSPCPKVTLMLDGSSDVATSQTQTAQAGTVTETQAFGLWLGAGYIGTPYVSAGIQWRDWQVDAKRSLDGWGGGVRYRLIAF